MTSRERRILRWAVLGAIAWGPACTKETSETDPRRRAYVALQGGDCDALRHLAADRTLPDSLHALFAPLPALCLAGAEGGPASAGRAGPGLEGRVYAADALRAAEALIRVQHYAAAFVRLTGDSTTADSLPHWLVVQRQVAIGWIQRTSSSEVLPEIGTKACRGERTDLGVLVPRLQPGGPAPHVFACPGAREWDFPDELTAREFAEPFVALRDSVIHSTAWYTCYYIGGPPAVAMRRTHRLWLFDVHTGAVVATTTILDVRQRCPFTLQVHTREIGAGFNAVEAERWLRRELARLAREGIADDPEGVVPPGPGRTTPRP
jgi:hypothetical protein